MVTRAEIALLSLARIPLFHPPPRERLVDEGDSLLRLGTLCRRTRGSKLFLHFPDYPKWPINRGPSQAPGNFQQVIVFRWLFRRRTEVSRHKYKIRTTRRASQTEKIRQR